MPPPNIVILVSHDTGRFVSPYGINTVDTPNFERLADESVRFANAFATAPQCSPSRAALFTGRYPHQNGVMGLCNPGCRWDLHETERPIGKLPGEAGYATWSIGTRHETTTTEHLGFEVTSSTRSILEMPSELDELLQARDKGQPFYCQLTPFETHRSWTGDGTQPDDSRGVTVPPYLNDGPLTRQEMAEMQGMSKRLDRGLGAIMGLMEEHDLIEDTIFVVTTDHGLALPRAKCTLYDSGIETLLFMRWPSEWQSGGARITRCENCCSVHLPEVEHG